MNARSQRRGRSGFAPDSLFTGLGRLPFRSPAPQDDPNLRAHRQTCQECSSGASGLIRPVPPLAETGSLNEANKRIHRSGSGLLKEAGR